MGAVIRDLRVPAARMVSRSGDPLLEMVRRHLHYPDRWHSSDRVGRGAVRAGDIPPPLPSSRAIAHCKDSMEQCIPVPHRRRCNIGRGPRRAGPGIGRRRPLVAIVITYWRRLERGVLALAIPGQGHSHRHPYAAADYLVWFRPRAQDHCHCSDDLLPNTGQRPRWTPLH